MLNKGFYVAMVFPVVMRAVPTTQQGGCNSLAPTDNKLVGSSKMGFQHLCSIILSNQRELNQELPSQFPQGQWLRRCLEVGGRKRRGKKEQQAKFQGVVLEKIAHMLSTRGSVLPV